MKKVLIGLGILIALFVLGIGGMLIFVTTALPNVGDAPEMEIELTTERIERGEYLANHVMMCVSCHSMRDYDKFAGPVKEGTHYTGGKPFDESIGVYVPYNLTPHHLGDWTDGEIFRAISAGVSKDGRALFPIMPHPNYGQLDEEDLKSVIAYLRTLESVQTDSEESVSNFPMNFIINTIPKKPEFKEIPDYSDILSYGKYLTIAGSCNECHTEMDGGQYVGEYMAGGNEFDLPNGAVSVAGNITPHDQTGIGTWTEEQWIKRFKAYSDSNYVPRTIEGDDYQSIMPWTEYSGMTEEDLKALYSYFMSIPAVENEVEKFIPPSANKSDD